MSNKEAAGRVWLNADPNMTDYVSYIVSKYRNDHVSTEVCFHCGSETSYIFLNTNEDGKVDTRPLKAVADTMTQIINEIEVLQHGA